MTPLELQRALAQMPSRSAQTLIFRCLEGRTARECAALYGIGLPQWEVLYFDAARAFAGDLAPLADPLRAALAQRLQRASQLVFDTGGSLHLARDRDAPPPVAGDPELAEAALRDPAIAPLVARLRALTDQREEVQQLILETERAAAASPARAREGWLRKIAVLVIIAVSVFVWLRERSRPPPEPRPAPVQFPLPGRPVR